jgi:hypothetical protein
VNISIDDREKELLLSILDKFITDKLVEERHTKRRSFRAGVIEVEAIAESLRKKIAGL